MKRIFIIALACLTAASAFAQDKAPEQKLKFYGFVRNYFAFDSRESSAGTEDLYYYMPKDQSLNSEGVDLNAVPSFRYAALTSRLGLDILGYELDGYKIAGKIEADFYSGVSGVTGTAQFRLRQAYVTVAKNSRTWKIGQAWHPMAIDIPDIFSLESGVPFGPFSRTPQVDLVWKLSDSFSLDATALWQMQYTSTGPKITSTGDPVAPYKYAATASADYIKYACTPEIYLGVIAKTKKSTFKAGVDVLSIKPRSYDYNLLTGKPVAKVADRLTTVNYFLYGTNKLGNWVLKEKVTYANDGSHMNLVGGYGVTDVNSDGSWSYTATNNVSAWMTVAYKKKDCKWVPSLFLGYIENLGTNADVTASYFKNSASTMKRMYRIQPELLYNLGKLQFGLEYMMTSVQFGKAGKRIMAEDNLHWITNNRVQMMVKYTF